MEVGGSLLRPRSGHAVAPPAAAPVAPWPVGAYASLGAGGGARPGTASEAPPSARQGGGPSAAAVAADAGVADAHPPHARPSSSTLAVAGADDATDTAAPTPSGRAPAAAAAAAGNPGDEEGSEGSNSSAASSSTLARRFSDVSFDRLVVFVQTVPPFVLVPQPTPPGGPLELGEAAWELCERIAPDTVDYEAGPPYGGQDIYSLVWRSGLSGRPVSNGRYWARRRTWRGGHRALAPTMVVSETMMEVDDRPAVELWGCPHCPYAVQAPLDALLTHLATVHGPRAVAGRPRRVPAAEAFACWHCDATTPSAAELFMHNFVRHR